MSLCLISLLVSLSPTWPLFMPRSHAPSDDHLCNISLDHKQLLINVNTRRLIWALACAHSSCPWLPDTRGHLSTSLSASHCSLSASGLRGVKSHLGACLWAALGLVTLTPTQEVVIQFPANIRYHDYVLSTCFRTFYEVADIVDIMTWTSWWCWSSSPCWCCIPGASSAHCHQWSCHHKHPRGCRPPRPWLCWSEYNCLYSGLCSSLSIWVMRSSRQFI